MPACCSTSTQLAHTETMISVGKCQIRGLPPFFAFVHLKSFPGSRQEKRTVHAAQVAIHDNLAAQNA